MTRSNRCIFALALYIFLSLGICSPTFGDSKSCEPWVGKLVSGQGEVEVRKMGQSQWQPTRLNETFCPGDSVKVGRLSRAAMRLPNDLIIKIDEQSTITFPPREKQKHTLIDILRGALYFFNHRPTDLKITTPFVNAAVEGTEFFIQVAEVQTFISVFDGRVAATNDWGGISLSKGQSAIAKANKSPVAQIINYPFDAVKWALYYPPILNYRADEFPESTHWQSQIRKSINSYWKGDLASAFSSLDGIPGDMENPRFFIYRAGLLLTVGRVDEAVADINRALALDPSQSAAVALESVIATTQNKKELALELAAKALSMNEQSAAAHMAMSYARQARFELEDALVSVQQAVNLDKKNGLAWARLAELWASTGHLDNALDAAETAANLNPDLARTQTVLGFAFLSQIKTKDAKSAFESAITLDQAAPLPRLGLGLVKIRDGDLQAGGREIEIAAGLDPNNSLIRSYQGKVYFEEKRTGLDEREYIIAKELDPNDPTPWFYDAIAKQTANRPVEALHDLQKAIELNNNRAVYRSKLMLDSDLAARSSSLARIYNNLGFQQLGLVEGWNSINTDPTNFSAHRLLSDSYSVLPRYKIARVSELLQSQLLQPINITPIQPTLAESDLFLINASGPGNLSFNEFNPLFNRNRATFQGSGLVGSNDTYGGETVVSGIDNKLSMSAGYSHFQTEGWQDNADQNDDIANIFGQYEISSISSIQAEYRYRNSERGDLAQLFFEDNFAPNLRYIEEVNQIRFGFHHTFSPGSDWIGNFQFADADRTRSDFDQIVTRFDIETEEEGYGGELSYLFRSDPVSIITGGGYYKVKKDDTVFVDYFGVPSFSETVDKGVNHTNLYLYSYINPVDDLTITAGASGDLFDPEDEKAEVKRDQFNPKLGFSWRPLSGTILRGAVFRVLKRTLIANQTIEPTQVSGFNQFFDEYNATDYWVYGTAIDQKVSQSVYGGLKLSYRNLTVPVYYTDSGTEEQFNWDEYLVHGYLFWTPHVWLSLSVEYLFEGLERDEEFSDGAQKADTHRVPLGINFFHPSGLSGSLKGTYVDQSGKFEKFDDGTFRDDRDEFFLVDIAIRYRLPKRYGFMTIGVKNLTDESFQYFNSEMDNLFFQPNRVFFSKITLEFP